MTFNKALIILSVFFLNQDSYAASQEWKEAKMSFVEQTAAREVLEKEFAITIDQLLDETTKGVCLAQLSDNATVMGGEMATKLGLTNGEGLVGQLERNEITKTDFDTQLDKLSVTRITNCVLAYLPQDLK